MEINSSCGAAAGKIKLKDDENGMSKVRKGL